MADRLYSSDRNSISLYSKLFKEYFDTLFNYGIRVTNDKDLVKDSIQELFFKIWKNKIDLSHVNNPIKLPRQILKSRSVLNFRPRITT